MKMKFITLAIVGFLSIQSFGQCVLNVRAFEEDGTVMVLYDLFTTKTEKEFYITLKYSRDGGKVFTPIPDAKGDANKNVKVGTERSIVWRPSSITEAPVVFKVEAESKQVEVSVSHTSGKIILSNALRVNADVEFTFSFRSTRHASNMFVAANFQLVDDKGQSYQSATVTQDNRTGAAIICEPELTTQFKVRIHDVPQNVSRFSRVEFTLSEIPVKLSDIKIWQ
jgi:hypothetical protein